MIVIEKNEGAKIPYEVTGTKLCFDDDLTINLAKREDDNPVHIDICFDGDNSLVIGSAAGRFYVAEIDIPARKYQETEVKDGEETIMQFSPIPFDMDKTKLTLWAIEQKEVIYNE